MMREKVRKRIREAKTSMLAITAASAWLFVGLFNYYLPGVLFGSIYEGLRLNPLATAAGFALFLLAVVSSIFLLIKISEG